jgi:hypothetical protein
VAGSLGIYYGAKLLLDAGRGTWSFYSQLKQLRWHRAVSHVLNHEQLLRTQRYAHQEVLWREFDQEALQLRASVWLCGQVEGRRVGHDRGGLVVSRVEEEKEEILGYLPVSRPTVTVEVPLQRVDETTAFARRLRLRDFEGWQKWERRRMTLNRLLAIREMGIDFRRQRATIQKRESFERLCSEQNDTRRTMEGMEEREQGSLAATTPTNQTGAETTNTENTAGPGPRGQVPQGQPQYEPDHRPEPGGADASARKRANIKKLRGSEWRIATVNIRQTRDSTTLAILMQEHHLDIIVLTECARARKMTNCEVGNPRGTFRAQLIWGNGADDFGVGFMVRRSGPNPPRVCHVEFPSTRLGVLKVQWKRTKVNIVGAYAPTEGHLMEVKRPFWDKLSEVLSSIGDRYIIMGDLNAHLPSRVDHKAPNDNGRLLSELLQQHELSICNIDEDKPKRMSWTWKMTPQMGGGRAVMGEGDQERTGKRRFFVGYRILDLIIVQKKYGESIRRVRAVLPFTTERWDHRLVRCRFRPMWRLPPGKPTGRLVVEDDRVETAADSIFTRLRKRLEESAPTPTKKDYWKKMWMTQDVWNRSMEVAAANKSLRQKKCTANRDRLKAAQAALSQAKREATDKYWIEWAKEVELALDIDDQAKAFHMIRRRYKPRPVSLPSDEEALTGCNEHFKKVLAPEVKDAKTTWPELKAATPPAEHATVSTTEVRQVNWAVSEKAWATTIITAHHCIEHANGKTWGKSTKAGSTQRSVLCAVISALESTAETIELQLRPAKNEEWLRAGMHCIRAWSNDDFDGVPESDLWRTIGRACLVNGRQISVSMEGPGLSTALHEGFRDILLKRAVQSSTPPTRKEQLTPIPWTGPSESTPMKHEILLALKSVRDSAPGPDGIHRTDLNDQQAQDILVELVQHCWEHGVSPKAFTQATIITLPKKGSPASWDDYRGITLLSIAGKVLTKILHSRIKGAPIANWQHGFRKGHSTHDAIIALKSTMDEARRTGHPIVCTFVDLTKAYDTVPRNLLWETVTQRGFGEKALKVLQSLYDDDVHVRLGTHITTKGFKSTTGVRQGCLLSPNLFNWVFDRILRTAEESLSGVAFQGSDGEVWLHKLEAYADDVVLLAHNMQKAQEDFTVFEAVCKAAGLQVSTKKTKVLRMKNMRPAPVVADENDGPLQKTPDGAIYHVYPAPQGDGLLACPYENCILEDRKFKGDVCLRAHFEKIHGLVVNVMKHPPVEIEITNTGKDANGNEICMECNQTFGLEKSAKAHWKRRRCHKAAFGALGTIWVSGAKRELVRHDTTKEKARAVQAVHGLADPGEEKGAKVKDSNGHALEEVDEFCYLGRMVTSSGDDKIAVQKRISIARATMNSIFRQMRSARSATKMKVWHAVIRAQLVYGAETWATSEKMKVTLNRFQMVWLRRFTNSKPKFDHLLNHIVYPYNTDVLKKADASPLADIVDQQRLRFYGHVLRYPVNDKIRRALVDRIPLEGRPGAVHAGHLRYQLEELRIEAELALDDATDRHMWRKAGIDLLKKRRGLREAATGRSEVELKSHQGDPDETARAGDGL